MEWIDAREKPHPDIPGRYLISYIDVKANGEPHRYVTAATWAPLGSRSHDWCTAHRIGEVEAWMPCPRPFVPEPDAPPF